MNPTLATRRQIALIDETRCIGCFKCLRACPEQAIVGAARWMHTVLRALCTGCENCLPPCPENCITFLPAAPLDDSCPMPTTV
ncbi:MAG: RnfABCDGE type electron transport complex subunit B [Ferrovum sp.]|jgi:electron transport complex protein RnfB|nr:RnfABCDGE type electron transport complex subunit B [Ferrovum sp.]MBW8066440.1 RnfABCDGE type electron transport complex subunit B [Ferrovum sp.]